MKKKSSIIIVFCIGLLIFTYPHLAQKVNHELQESQVSEFQDTEIPDDEIIELKLKSARCNEQINNDSDGFRDPFGADRENLQQFSDCYELYDNEIFAVLEIPKLALSVPIYLGATDQILNDGVGQVGGSSLPIGGKSTHTVLAGHRGMWTKAMFRDVDQLQPGDVFNIHYLNETLTYEVYAQRVIEPDDSSSLEIVEGKDLATLLTCHPYRENHQRLLILAERKP